MATFSINGLCIRNESLTKTTLTDLVEGPQGLLVAPWETVEGSRTVVQVPTQEAGLSLLKQALGIRGRPKKAKDDDDKSDRSPKHVESDVEDLSDVDSEDSESESE